jgi:hypothetical protein
VDSQSRVRSAGVDDLAEVLVVLAQTRAESPAGYRPTTAVSTAPSPKQIQMWDRKSPDVTVCLADGLHPVGIKLPAATGLIPPVRVTREFPDGRGIR